MLPHGMATMNRSFTPESPTSSFVDGQLRVTLLVLERALYYAEHLKRSPVEFALTFDELANYGSSEKEIRWLLANKYITDVSSRFDSAGLPINLREGLFLITESGRQLCYSSRSASSRSQPFWCPDRRELLLGETLIKAYRVPSPNQQTVLEVFQEEGWPRRIDDPLPPKEGIEIKRRLIETIKSLNRAHQAVDHLRFFGDGTGRGVCWKLAKRSNA